MEEPKTTTQRDKLIFILLALLPVIATLIEAVPGYISLKAKSSQITYTTRVSEIAFPTNANSVRIKQLLDKERIPDASFVVSLNNSGDQQASNVKVSITVPGNVLAANSRPSPQDNPAWVDITAPQNSTNNASLVTYDIKNMAVGPKLEIEVSYSRSESGIPKCEIYADGISAKPVEETAKQRSMSGLFVRSAVIFIVALTFSTIVFFLLRMKQRPELKSMLRLVADYLFPFFGLASYNTERASKAVPASTAKPVSSVLRFEAKDAQLHGTVIQYELDEVMDNVGFWNLKEDFVTWKFQVSQPTTFLIVIEQACQKGCGGEYFIIIGLGRLPAKVVETGTWQNFTRCRVGHVNISKPGEYILQIEPIRVQGALMNVRTVFLYPINLK